MYNIHQQQPSLFLLSVDVQDQQTQQGQDSPVFSASISSDWVCGKQTVVRSNKQSKQLHTKKSRSTLKALTGALLLWQPHHCRRHPVLLGRNPAEIKRCVSCLLQWCKRLVYSKECRINKRKCPLRKTSCETLQQRPVTDYWVNEPDITNMNTGWVKLIIRHNKSTCTFI